jgi:hypothetical protein
MSSMNQFLSKIELEKTAADDSAKKEPEGKTTETVADAQAAQDNRGAEMQQDLKEGIGGVEADTEEAAVKAGDGDEPTDDQGPNSLGADEKVNEGDAMIKSEETPVKEASEVRANRLGDAILKQVVEMQKEAEEAPAEEAPAEEVTKEASEQEEVNEVAVALEKFASENPELKEALDAQYHEFAQGFMRGVEKKAEDIQDMIDSGLCKTAEEAEALLDAAVAADPAAALPEEALMEGLPALDEAPMEEVPALPEEALAGAEEAVAGPEGEMDQIGAMLEQAGVTEEDLIAAANEIQALTDVGVAPEEIIEATEELAAEDSVAAGTEIPKEAEAVIHKRAFIRNKQAQERVDLIKEYIRNLNK